MHTSNYELKPYRTPEKMNKVEHENHSKICAPSDPKYGNIALKEYRNNKIKQANSSLQQYNSTCDVDANHLRREQMKTQKTTRNSNALAAVDAKTEKEVYPLFGRTMTQ